MLIGEYLIQLIWNSKIARSSPDGVEEKGATVGSLDYFLFSEFDLDLLPLS